MIRATYGIRVTVFIGLSAGAHGIAQSGPPMCPEGASEVVLYFDDFESDQGWMTVPSGNPMAGHWERANPHGTGAQPEDDFSPDGTDCFVTGNGDFCPAPQTPPCPSVWDVDGGPMVLTSPVLDLPADAIIRYARWFHWAGNGTPDFLTVEVSNNNGATWTTVETVGGITGWQLHSFVLADFVAPTSLVRVRFSVADSPNDSLTEAAIDDFTVIRCGLTSDLDGDGDADLADYEALHECLTGPAAAVLPSCGEADLSVDGHVDLRDFSLFANSFTG